MEIIPKKVIVMIGDNLNEHVREGNRSDEEVWCQVEE